MNPGMADIKGRSQDPVDQAWRSIRTHYSNDIKRHLRVHVHRFRSEPITNIQLRIAQANYLMAYAENLRIREVLHTLIPGTNEHKGAIWTLCKTDENMKRLAATQGIAGKAGANRNPRLVPPMRPREDSSRMSPTEDTNVSPTEDSGER